MTRECFLLLACVIVFSIGCQSDPTPTAQSPIVVIQKLDTAQNVRAEDIYRPESGTMRYYITGDDVDGKLLVRETSESDKYKSQWMTVESIVTGGGDEARATKFWSIDDKGDALLHASIDHEENALTLFNPPLVMAPAELAAGKSSEATSPMRVVSDSNPAQRKETGDAHQTITNNGMVRLRTALGELDAVKLTIEFEADMSMADATETTELYINADHGVIAERRTRTVKILGGIGGGTHEEILTIAGEN